MSSSNSVRLAYLAEATYGTTPASGNFDRIRFSTESLSGTPKVVVSDEVRDDRQPTGQKQVGLTLGGDVDGVLAPTTWINDMVEAGMLDTYNAKVDTGAATIAMGDTGTTLTRSAGSYVSDGFAVGDLVEVQGMTTAANNTFVYVSAVEATILTIVGPSTLSDEAGSGDEHVVRHAYVEIGSDTASFSIEKNFTDLTTKTISYRGMRVNTMGFDFQHGQIAKFSCGFAGGGGSTAYETPATEMTDSRTVNAAGTEVALNATDDMSLTIVDGAVVTFCIESLQVQVNNGMQAQECIGSTAPSNQIAGEAGVTVNMSAYLADTNFAYHGKKITDTPIALHFPVYSTAVEGYAFSMPAIQLSFPDASSSGRNQQTKLPMAGVCKPTSTLNALRIYKITQA